MTYTQGKSARAFTLVGYAVFLLGVEQAYAVCPPGAANRAPGGEPFRYALALAESFSQANAAVSKAAAAEAASRNPVPSGELPRLINQLKSGSEDYKCAAEAVAPFAKSRDEKIALSAQAVAFTYSELVKLDELKIGIIQSVLDGKLRPGDLAGRLARSRAPTDEAWRLLISSTVMATFMLVQPPEQEGEKPSTLLITAQEKTMLTGKLEEDFGPLLQGGTRASQTPPVGAAQLLHGFVSNTDWKTSDAR